MIAIFKENASLLALAVFMIFLSGCSTKFSTLKTDEGTIIYKLDEKEAFKIAHRTMLNVFPGRKLTVIDGAAKGFKTYTRFLLDTYSQQVLIFAANGKDQSGNKVQGYYFEVSGSGSSVLQGRAKNVELFETLSKNLQNTKTRVFVTNMQSQSYKTKIKETVSTNSSSGSTLVFDKLERLKKLYDKGIITKDEFNSKKTKLMKDI